MKYENQFLNYNASALANVNRGAMTTQDFSMPNIPQQSVVVRGSALSNVNRNNVVMDSRSSLGDVAQLDPLIKRRTELEGQLATIDAEIESLLNEIEKQKQHRVDLDNLIKQYIQWIADYDNKGDLYKISHPNERKGYERKRDLYSQEFDSTTQQINSLTDKYNNDLIPKRKVLEDKLVALGRPVPRRPRAVIEGRGTATLLDTANKIAENVSDSVSNVFRGGFGGGGFGGGGGADMREDTGTAQSFFGKNKLAILALGGIVGYLLIKR